VTTTQSSTAGQRGSYRDATAGVEDRVEDLLGRMTLAEKAGLMFHTTIVVGEDGELTEGAPDFGIGSSAHLVAELGINHFNLLGAAEDNRTLAEWHNRLQRHALKTRLGIPVTLSTDPRHHFTDNPLTSAMAGSFSQWPEPLGLAALRSPELVRRFADIARQEYTAVGLRVALHPQIDLATEPRWGRISGTFGEDADLTGELVAAAIRGYQGEVLGPDSVATMVKHFPGGGPQLDGEDPHFAYGREQVYPGDNLDYHLKPFLAAFAAGGSQVMPYYGMPVGTVYDEVAFGFNRGVITGLLREKLGFDGIVCTDWGLVTDSTLLGENMTARAWGVEGLDAVERTELILNAGCDQFGGESAPELVVSLVEQGRITEERIDRSVRRLLREKFVLGLFDKPFVDPDKAAATVGNPVFAAEGADAQRRAYTLLTNRDEILPLGPGLRVYAEGVDAELLGRRATVVADPADADIALVRLKAPREAREGLFESLFPAGSLEFPQEEKDRQSALYRRVPTIVDLYLDRPAVVPGIAAEAAALTGSYGSSDAAFLDVVFGVAEPEGALPFDLPSSMAAIIASRTDVPFDTAEPLFRFGHGLRYSRHLQHVGRPPAEQPAPVERETASKATGPVTAAGTWVLTIQTPRGEQQGELRLAGEGGTPTGTFNGAPITDGRLSGDQLTFRTSLTSPMKVKIKCTAAIDGDTLSGTAKAAMIPLKIPFTGVRH
jgi:beta-glucosidase